MHECNEMAYRRLKNSLADEIRLFDCVRSEWCLGLRFEVLNTAGNRTGHTVTRLFTDLRSIDQYFNFQNVTAENLMVDRFTLSDDNKIIHEEVSFNAAKHPEEVDCEKLAAKLKDGSERVYHQNVFITINSELPTPSGVYSKGAFVTSSTSNYLYEVFNNLSSFESIPRY